MKTALSLTLMIVSSSLASCAQPSEGPPPIMSAMVCGVTFKALGEPVVDIFAEGFPPNWIQRSPTLGRDLVVQVAEDCEHGSQVTIAPADAFRTVRTVWVADHLPAALVLEPLRPVPATLVAYRHGRELGMLRLDIPKGDISGK